MGLQPFRIGTKHDKNIIKLGTSNQDIPNENKIEQLNVVQ